METPAEQIDLMLARVSEHKPLLENGISGDAAKEAPRPGKDESFIRKNRNADRSDLAEQRWGLVVPEGKDGDALLDAVAPLVAFRAEEQGIEPMVFRVPPGMNRKASKEWLSNEYDSEDIEEADRPFYLCMLGGPELISLELQHTAGHGAYVGRVHFDKPKGKVDLDAYAAYAKKVVEYARFGHTEEAPDLRYYVAPDGTAATRNAKTKLVSPSLDTAQSWVANKNIKATVREIDASSVDTFLAANESSCPSVLLSVSHGLGGPPDDYETPDEQRMRQGALVVGYKEILDAQAMSEKTFLPGGLWVFFACFSAGTPATSEFHKWLNLLAKSGAYKDSAKAVLSSLAISGPGFIAALPQAALRNSKGPLAVIGHMDLAWNFSYVDPMSPSSSRSSRFTKVLQHMVKGARVGAAQDEIAEGVRVANFELTTMYDAAEEVQPDTAELVKRGRIWMQRNDLRGYILLGDPAVRLPQAEPKERKPALKAASVAREAPATITAAAKEAAVKALVEGNETPRAIAARTGCSLPELFEWFETHRATKRKA